MYLYNEIEYGRNEFCNQIGFNYWDGWASWRSTCLFVDLISLVFIGILYTAYVGYAAYDFTWWRYSVFEIYVVDTDTNIEIEDYADTLVSKLFLGQPFDRFHSSVLYNRIMA